MAAGKTSRILQSGFWLLALPLQLFSLAIYGFSILLPTNSPWRGRLQGLASSTLENALGNGLWALALWALGALGLYTWQTDDLSGAFPPQCTYQLLCVAVAGLDGDDEHATQTRYVRDTLDEILNTGDANAKVEIVTIPQRLNAPLGGSLLESQRQAETKTRAWLRQLKASVLVYGSVRRADKVLKLYIIGTNGSQSSGYRVDQSTFLLEPKFAKDLIVALAASIATDETGVIDQERYSAQLLEPLAGRLQSALFFRSSWLTGETRARILLSYARLSAVIGNQVGDSQRLKQAVKTLREAVRIYTESKNVHQTIEAQDDLGITLAMLGEVENDPALLQEAIATMQATVDVYKNTGSRTDWGRLQNSLGFAHSLLASANNDKEQFRQAMAAFDAALSVNTRQAALENWTLIQLNIGFAWMQRGQSGGGIEDLQRAATHFRAVTNEGTRKSNPLAWAQAQHNLGASLVAISRLSGKHPEYLTDGITALVEALRVRTPEQSLKDWAETETDLASAYTVFGQVHQDRRALTKATALASEVTVRIPRSRMPSLWAVAQINLGQALLGLGDRETGIASLTSSAKATKDALTSLDPDTSTVMWFQAQSNLAVAYSKIGERTQKPEPFKIALESYDAILRRISKNDAPLLWVQTEINRAATLSSLGTLSADPGALRGVEKSMTDLIPFLRTLGADQFVVAAQSNLAQAKSALAKIDKASGGRLRNGSPADIREEPL